MKPYYTIGEISRMFNVPSSTIRFWEEEGCITLTRAENGYRCFDLRAMIDLCRLMLYRDLEVPVRLMKNLPEMGTDDMNELLEDTKRNMLDRIEFIQKKIAAINEKQRLIKLQKSLEEKMYTEADIPFEKVIEFRFTDTALLKEYFENQHRLVLVMSIENGYTPIIGFSVPRDYKSSSVLWERTESGKFIRFLLKVQQNDIQKNDLKRHIDELKKGHTMPSVVIAQYIDTCSDNGILTDCNCAWAAVGD